MAEILTMGELLVEIMRPEKDVKLSETGNFRGPFPSGAPGIFIDTVARLGHGAQIISGVGNDDFGDNVLNRLKRDGVKADLVEVFDGKTTAAAFVMYYSNGERDFVYHFDGTPAVMARFDIKKLEKLPVYFHLMGCSLLANRDFKDSILEAVDTLYKKGVKLSFDPNLRKELMSDNVLEDVVNPVLEKCSILLPGTDELVLVTGKDDIGEAITLVQDRFGIGTIVLKRGKKGCRVYTPEETIEVPGYTVQEVDPTGAGDCFDAAFLCGLLEGRDLSMCGKMASAAGALNAAAFGPMEGDIGPDTVMAMIEENR